MRDWQRSQVPTAWRYGSRFSSWPRSSHHATTRSSASSWSSPSKLAGVAFMRPSGPITVSVVEPVVAADLEVDGVVARRDLERAGAELRVDALVGDHRHAALDDGHDDLAPDRVAVALVVGMHRHRDVGEDRRRAHGRDRDRALAVGERVANVVRACRRRLDVLDLEVRDRRLVVRAPVDDPVRAVDPARFPETDEERHHRLDVARRPS